MMNDKHDNNISNPTKSAISFFDLCERRYSRRRFLKVSSVIGMTPALIACEEQQPVSEVAAQESEIAKEKVASFDFVEIEHGMDVTHHVAPDHTAEILIKWGDPLFADAPEFDLNNQAAERQSRQFGYNNDFVGFVALPPDSQSTQSALLCVNHEYPLAGLMFPNMGRRIRDEITEEQVNVSKASIGVSIFKVDLVGDSWSVDLSSKYNRRISALDSQIEMSGPAAGHARLMTTQDPTGRRVIGTLNNCAGGMTPWGTYLTCEENFNFHFNAENSDEHAEVENHERYNLARDSFNWSKYDKRFDVSQEPNEPNRFGWVVEIDPMNPDSIPKKRTALGRFKHEGAENVIADDGRLVVYMGDDQRFEYVYKFVSRDTVDLDNNEANRDLLDAGTVYVAKFYDDGRLEWLALEHSNPALKAHFASQADILIQLRSAADLLGATPMDRPEDIVPNKDTGKVYVMLTNNTRREEVDAANPRENNSFGHIIEISESQQNFSGTAARWDILVKCGDPSNPEHAADWSEKISENGWFASPDNGVIDPAGRLWVSTDQGEKTPLSGTADGLWSLETEGDMRGVGKMFFRAPLGAETCGPVFSDDGESLFLAVQHPGNDEVNGRTRIESALTRWPDFIDGQPPRPSIVVIRKKAGGVVG